MTGGLGHENRVNRGSDLNEVQRDCEQRRCRAQEVAGLFWRLFRTGHGLSFPWPITRSKKAPFWLQSEYNEVLTSRDIMHNASMKKNVGSSKISGLDISAHTPFLHNLPWLAHVRCPAVGSVHWPLPIKRKVINFLAEREM